MTDLSFRAAQCQIADLRRTAASARLAAAGRSSLRKTHKVRTTRPDQTGGNAK